MSLFLTYQPGEICHKCSSLMYYFPQIFPLSLRSHSLLRILSLLYVFLNPRGISFVIIPQPSLNVLYYFWVVICDGSMSNAFQLCYSKSYNLICMSPSFTLHFLLLPLLTPKHNLFNKYNETVFIQHCNPQVYFSCRTHAN